MANRLYGKTKGRIVGPDAATVQAPPASDPECHDHDVLGHDQPQEAWSHLMGREELTVTGRTILTIAHAILGNRSHGEVMLIDEDGQIAHIAPRFVSEGSEVGATRKASLPFFMRRAGTGKRAGSQIESTQAG